MIETINSSFETSVRLLILFEQMKVPLNFERILHYDLIACFGKDYGVTESNLHGADHIMTAELPARRMRVKNAVRRLVQEGYVWPQEENAFLFQISDSGRQFVQKLNSEYADQYASAIRDIHLRFSSCSDTEVLKIICSRNKEIIR